MDIDNKEGRRLRRAEKRHKSEGAQGFHLPLWDGDAYKTLVRLNGPMKGGRGSTETRAVSQARAASDTKGDRRVVQPDATTRQGTPSHTRKAGTQLSSERPTKKTMSGNRLAMAAGFAALP